MTMTGFWPRVAMLLAIGLVAGCGDNGGSAPQSGLQTSESGLKYQIIEEGFGKRPAPSDRVEVHYRGTLDDGSEFDSSHERGKPAVFPLGGVIPGWTEGLQLIKEGGKIRLIIPPDLAYGARGVDGVVPPGATLTFEVELLRVF